MNGTTMFVLWQQHTQKFILTQIFNQQCQQCDRWVGGEPYVQDVRSMIEDVIAKWSNPSKRSQFKGQQGDPDGPHDTERCEACRLGMCTRSKKRGGGVHPGDDLVAIFNHLTL